MIAERLPGGRVLIDTGPVVALLDQDDPAHAACQSVFAGLRRPVHTTWPVITEAAWLLRKVPGGVQGVLTLVESNIIACVDLGPEAAGWIREFLDRYADLRPQLADASLVYVAERLGTETIFTLDRRDFTVFRTVAGRPFRLLPENA